MCEWLLEWDRTQIVELFTSWGEPAFRAQQLWDWIYQSLADDFDSMRNLPLALRSRLVDHFRLDSLRLGAQEASDDGETIKLLFELVDGRTIETVLMRYAHRCTVCISTQVGCAMGCPFCATGQGGFERNLAKGEIVAQVLYAARAFRDQGAALSNVVVMGMGEPLVNYRATLAAIRRLMDEKGFNMGARRFTLSTVGFVPGIQRLSREGLQVGLAVSLHAPTDARRNELVPLNRRFPLGQLLPACRDFVERTGRRVTFEYALVQEVNDWPEQAEELANLVRGLRCHVNLIPLNPAPGSPFVASEPSRVRAFQEVLERRRVPTTVRLRRGIDIQAGCGQLRTRFRPSLR
ncbi:MAG: 23S rRNA (adenine(2503)-C(2))-methyltransferase RlmN [Chloroflexota bacterium]